MDSLLKVVICLVMFAVIAIIYKCIGRWTYEASKQRSFLLAIDRKIPFIPETALVYLSIHVFWVPVAFAPDISASYFIRIAAAIVGMFCIFSVIYWLIPSAYPRPAVDNSRSFSLRIVAWLYRDDLPNNTFPSTHAGSTTMLLCAAHEHMASEWYVYYLAWGALIIVSTLTLKQHYLLDAITGVILAFFISYFLLL